MGGSEPGAASTDLFTACPHCDYRFRGALLVAVCPECRKPLRSPVACQHCGYSMFGIEDREVCPECGKPPVHAARCKRCFYVLKGLARHGTCPECAWPYSMDDEASFTRKPPFVPWSYWWPALTLAVGASLAIFLVCVFVFKSWGTAIWIAPAVCAGTVLGYSVRFGRWLPWSALIVTVLMALGMVVPGLGGVFCFLALLAILFGPICIGIMLGSGLRGSLKKAGHSQASWMPVLAVMALTFVVILWEGKPTPMPLETVRTSAVLRADAETAWRSIMYYEQVRHEPPLILRVGLARPLATRGRSDRVGDIKTCLYNKGFISKRTTKSIPGEVLAFEVIEQRIGYEHDVRLKSGAFEFEGLDDGTTRVTLSTTYEPLLSPRWVWGPFERYAVHTLHGHVLEGMRLEAEEAPAFAAVVSGVTP